MSSLSRVFGSSWGRIAIIIAVAVSLVVSVLPANAVLVIARSNYVVRVLPGTDAAVRANLASMGGVPTDEIDYVFDGFVVKLSDAEVAALRTDKNVVDIIADAPISLLDTDNSPSSWGLDRVDQTSLPLDSSFTYPNQGGAGVRVYVVDTGVQADNPDFAGRILPGFDVIGSQQQNTDCNGHGTHVAGTVAGTRYGLAKKAMIVPVRVLGCTGSGSFSGIISALDWIKANNPAGTPAVINMSIGGGFYQAVNDAVESIVAAGITAAIAAGNSNADACNASPASAPSAITVGATDSSDSRASYSNWGNCVDIFAPGSNIVSDDAFASGSSSVKSGTSMATPHIAGAAALVLGQHPTWTPGEVLTAISDNASIGKIANANSAKSGLLNIGFLNSSVTPDPVAGVPDAPTAVRVGSVTANSAAITWTAPANDGGSLITSYTVQYRESAVAAWNTVTSTTTSANLTGLAGLASYQVQVIASNSVGDSAASAIATFTTLGSTADAPTSFRVTMDHGNYVKLAWLAPANGGNAITSYTVQQMKAGVWTTLQSNSTLTTATASGLTPLTPYSFRVWATNASGAGPAALLDYTTGPAAAAAPTLTVVPTATGAEVSWSPVSSTDPAYAVSYEISYGYQGYLTPLQTVVQSTAGYTITGLRWQMPSWVKVQALVDKTSSGANSYYFTTLAAAPSAPAWQSTTKTATGFTLNWAVVNTGGSAVIDYTVQTAATNTTATVWTDFATVTTTSVDVPFPAAGKPQYYRVAARNSVGLGAYNYPTAVFGPTVAADAPTGLTVVPYANTSRASLAWLAPANNGGASITGYQIQHSLDQGATWVSLATIPNVLSFTTSTSYKKGTAVLFRVAAVTSAGTGAFTAPVSYSFTKTAPGAPSKFAGTVANSGIASLSWLAPADNGGSELTGYRIERQSSTGWDLLATAEASATTASANLGAPGTVARLRLIAVSEVGAGAPTSTLALTVPVVRPDAPQNLTVAMNAAGNGVVLTWEAPANLYGSAVTRFAWQYSADGGTRWTGGQTNAPANSTGAGTITLSAPAKGVTYQYRVAIITAGGTSGYSNLASFTRAASAPSAPYARSGLLGAGGVAVLAWYAPSDTGGSAITEYVIEANTSGVWAEAARVAAPALTWTGPVVPLGTTAQFRVLAVNAIGTSAASSVLSVRAPLQKPGAPTGVAVAQDSANASRVLVTWTPPANLGGATVASYFLVQVSANGGANWSGYTATGTSSSYSLSKPAKGQSYRIRVLTVTGYGASDASSEVSYSTAATVSSAPYGQRFVFGSDGNAIFSWYAPSDKGGVAITGYLVETAVANAATSTPAWSTPIAVAGTALSTVIPRANPGQYIYARVVAVNSVGNSAVSGAAAIMVPLGKPSAPSLSGAGTATSSMFTLSWAPPSSLGGATVASGYGIERSFNGGASWQGYTTAAGTATAYNVPAAAKGTTVLYRVYARTGYGVGEYSNTVSSTTAATAPGSPAGASLSLPTGATALVASWANPSDTGGSAITGFRVTVSANGNTWTELATVSERSVVAGPVPAAGGYLFVRVYAINAVGISAGYASASYRSAYLAPAPSGNPVVTSSSNSTSAAPRVTVSWAPSTNLGGAGLSYYRLQQSTDGTNWVTLVNTASTSFTMARPVAGTAVSYRVIVNSTAGLTATSGVTQVTY